MSAFAAVKPKRQKIEKVQVDNAEVETASELADSDLEDTPKDQAKSIPPIISSSLISPPTTKHGTIEVKLTPTDYLVVKGKYHLRTLSGETLIDGISVDQTNVNAPSLKAVPVITTPTQCRICLSNWRDGSEKIGSLSPRFKKIYVDGDQTFLPILSPDGSYGTTIPDSWPRIIDSIVKRLKKSRNVLFVGPRNSGKSTLLRLVLNRAIANQPVQLLDLDLEKSEYSMPLCISLSKHTQPILGLAGPCETRNLLIGFDTPQHVPLTYFAQMRKLVDSIDDFPLLINAPGWIKGFGVEIYKELASMLNLDDVVYVSDPEFEDTTVFLDQFPYKNLIEVHSTVNFTDVSAIQYSTRQFRDFQLLSYFHGTDFSPLLLKSPYIVRFDQISLLLLLDSNQNISDTDLCTLLEFQTVALLTVTDRAYNSVSHVNGDIAISTTGQDLLVHEGATFHGLALVHSVDLAKKQVNLYTPVDLEGLEGRLVLVKGSSHYPIDEIHPPLYQERQVPYISFETDLGIGGRAVAPRHNLHRHNG